MYRRGRFWYAQLYNPTTRKFRSGRSTGETDRNTATGVAVQWLEEGIPEPDRGRRSVKEALNIDTVLEAIRNTTQTLGDAERIGPPFSSRRAQGCPVADYVAPRRPGECGDGCAGKRMLEGPHNHGP